MTPLSVTTPPRLANLDRETFWPNHSWSDFRDLEAKESYLVILPIHGFADHGMGLPLDAEETIGSELLRRAIQARRADVRVRVLNPVRFCLAPLPATFFGIDPETAHALIQEIAESVRTSGFKKLVFFNTSPWNEEWVDAASRDTRASLGLQTFVINLGGLNLDFHPTSESRPQVQAAVAHILGHPPKPVTRPAEVFDADLRPGHWRQPPPVEFDPGLNAGDLLDRAIARLGSLLGEIQARPPLGTAPASDRATSAASIHPTHIPPGTQESLPWPTYRSLYLPALTREELEALPRKRDTLVIIPTGAIEQHGHHLPVGVDALLAQGWLRAALPKLPSDARVLIAPPITYGKSNEHTGFPGTVSISARTLRRLLLAAAEQLKKLGFARLAVFNTHGGNSAVLVYTLREIQESLGLRAGMIGLGYPSPLAPQEKEYGFHAGEWETSLLLALDPGLVRMERATCEYPSRIEDPGELRAENAPAIFSWLTSDISASGVMGDATAASRENGLRWLDEASTSFARNLARWSGASL